MPTPKKPVKAHPNRKFRVNAEVDSGASANGGLDFLDPVQIENFLPTPKCTPMGAYPPPAPASYTNDPDSTALLRTLPFHPADIIFTFPSYTAFPGSPRTYLTHMNNIVTLHNRLANAILSHHDTKYLSLALNAPEDVRRLEHGYIVLRAGIGEMIRDRVTEMFGSADED
ncbi:MAG: hypothetical protein M1823_007934, partial [Watsoniomyces obsoletus]